MATISNDHKALAQTALRTLLNAQLPAEQWQEVEIHLHRLQGALEQDDAEAFRQTLGELEQLSRPRIGQIGSPPATSSPAPEPTRDFINRMVHTLAPQKTTPPPDKPNDAPKPPDKGR